MRISHLLAALLALLIYLTPAQGETVNSVLANAPTAHPRLFLNAKTLEEINVNIEADPLLGQTRDHIIELADEMTNLPPLERIVEGRRLLSVSRACLRRMCYLGLAYQLTGDAKYAHSAEEQMLAVAAFSDWNPSHYLDTAEMTAALAIGYDWCYDALSPESREIIRQAIIEKGLQSSLVGEQWWITRNNNWNQVCHAGMVMGALVVYEQVPELSEKIIQRALDNIHHGMEVYAPDGNYPEGPMYWSYGTSFNVLLIDALQSVLGTDFDLAATPGFLDSAEYYLNASGPSGDYFNYADCNTRGGVAPPVFWFAEQSDDASLLWTQRSSLQAFLAGNHKPEGADMRIFPMTLIWASQLSEAPAPEKLSWAGNGEVPVGMHRSSWTDPRATFVAIKGGSPSAGHGHMDTGVFVMESDGVRWAIDLGMQGYHSLESKGVKLWGSERWKVFRLGSDSHSIVTVDGQMLSLTGSAPITKHEPEGDFPHTILDTSSAYTDQLAQAQRGVGLHPSGAVIIQDELQAPDREVQIRWAMITRADVSIDNDHQTTLRQDGEQLTLKVLSPAEARMTVVDIETPPNDYDEKNPNAKRLEVTATIPANARETLSILLQPGSVPSVNLSPLRLAQW